MTTTPSLSLRRKRAVEPESPPPVAAFAERVPDQPSIDVGRSDGPGVAVVFQVPLHLRDPNPAPMDPDAFRIGNDAPRHAALGLRAAGRVVAVATAVPLSLLMPALGSAAPPSLPEGQGDPQTQPEAETPPATEQAPASADAPPASSDKEELWQALVGEDLVLIKADQSRVDGRLLGVQNGRLVVARSGDGLVVDLDPQTVTGIYSPADELGPAEETPGSTEIDPELARKPGTGLMIGGGVLLGLSGTFFVSAAILGLSSTSYGYGYSSAASIAPLIVAGVLTAGGGIPMMVVGALRHKKLRAATEQRLRASVSPTPDGGWSTSLSLRF